MRRSFFVILVAAAACGGKQKSTTPPPPLPEPQAEAKPAEPPKPPEEAKPQVPAGPVDLTVAAPKVTVKLISAGKGKKAPLKLSVKAGAKQQVELAIDFRGKSTGLGAPDQEDVFPTFVLIGDAEVKNVDKDGNVEYQLTVNGTDARDVTGQKFTSDQAKEIAGALQGLTIGGTINANGSSSDLKMHLEQPKAASAGALGFMSIAFPALPVLPKEPVGVGAKWQVSSSLKVAEQLDVTHTTSYELVSRKGNTWTVKGTTKVSGADQKLGELNATKIGGTGAIDATLVDGALYPTMKTNVATAFSVSGTDPQTQQTVAGTLDLKQAASITPKGDASAGHARHARAEERREDARDTRDARDARTQEAVAATVGAVRAASGLQPLHALGGCMRLVVCVRCAASRQGDEAGR
jgi:hypothetical protein